MKLPKLDEAVVPPEKIQDYLLNVYHDEGSGKVQFFLHFGFSVAEWKELAQALMEKRNRHQMICRGAPVCAPAVSRHIGLPLHHMDLL
jgi:hypothetical protein